MGTNRGIRLIWCDDRNSDGLGMDNTFQCITRG